MDPRNTLEKRISATLLDVDLSLVNLQSKLSALTGEAHAAARRELESFERIRRRCGDEFKAFKLAPAHIWQDLRASLETGIAAMQTELSHLLKRYGG